MAAPTILIFDSGAGGLSVAREVCKQIRFCKIVYAADNEAFPYGMLSDEVLAARLTKIAGDLISEFSPDIFVIACNTASTIVLPTLRAHFTVPFVGVVPAIKPASLHTQTGVIGVLATHATTDRSYTKQLIDKYASDKHVVLYGSEHLVRAAEDYVLRDAIDIPLIEAELNGLLLQHRATDIDTIVLACTHFPLLLPYLKPKVGAQVKWIDSGEAIARRIKSLLPSIPVSHTNVADCSIESRRQCLVWLSEDSPDSKKIKQAYCRVLSSL